jgi:hypothetical protein
VCVQQACAKPGSCGSKLSRISADNGLVRSLLIVLRVGFLMLLYFS